MNPLKSSHLRLASVLILIVFPGLRVTHAEEVGDRWGTEEREREYYPIVNIPLPPDTVVEAGAFAVLPDNRVAVGTRRRDLSDRWHRRSQTQPDVSFVCIRAR